MNKYQSILTLIAAILVLPAAALAQDNESSMMVASNLQPASQMNVVDPKSLSEMRRDVYQAEEEFYALFNELNDEREFDVHCFYEKPTGTHIKNHVCRAKFVTKAFSKHASRNRNDLSRVANQSADPVFAEKSARYQQKMETLIADNPDLQAALIRYNTVRAQFFEIREGS